MIKVVEEGDTLGKSQSYQVSLGKLLEKWTVFCFFFCLAMKTEHPVELGFFYYCYPFMLL